MDAEVSWSVGRVRGRWNSYLPHFFLHFQLEEEEASLFASSIDRKKDLDLRPKKGGVGEVRGGFPSLDSWKDFLTLRFQIDREMNDELFKFLLNYYRCR
jgi:hypothetical protein